ncbi:MAG: XisI protein [Saprospiraceae bacterium]
MKNKVEQYEQFIIDILEEYKVGYQEYDWGNREDVLLIDKERHHYQLLTTGWQTGKHIHGIMMHLHIHGDGKIWIEANNTEAEIARELTDKGVPKSDIVLAFHPEKLRAMTGYAVA